MAASSAADIRKAARKWQDGINGRLGGPLQEMPLTKPQTITMMESIDGELDANFAGTKAAIPIGIRNALINKMILRAIEVMAEVRRRA